MKAHIRQTNWKTGRMNCMWECVFYMLVLVISTVQMKGKPHVFRNYPIDIIRSCDGQKAKCVSMWIIWLSSMLCTLLFPQFLLMLLLCLCVCVIEFFLCSSYFRFGCCRGASLPRQYVIEAQYTSIEERRVIGIPSMLLLLCSLSLSPRWPWKDH